MASKDYYQDWWAKLLCAEEPQVRLVVMRHELKRDELGQVRDALLLNDRTGKDVEAFLDAIRAEPPKRSSRNRRHLVILAYHIGNAPPSVRKKVRDTARQLLPEDWLGSEAIERRMRDARVRDTTSVYGAALAIALQCHTGATHVFAAISGDPVLAQDAVVQSALEASAVCPEGFDAFWSNLKARVNLVISTGAFLRRIPIHFERLKEEWRDGVKAAQSGDGAAPFEAAPLLANWVPLFRGGPVPPRTMLEFVHAMWVHEYSWEHLLGNVQSYNRAVRALCDGDVASVASELGCGLGEITMGGPDSVVREAAATYLRVAAAPSLRDALRFRARDAGWAKHLILRNLFPDRSPGGPVRMLGVTLLFPWSVRGTLSFLNRHLQSKSATLDDVRASCDLLYAPLARVLTPHIVGALTERSPEPTELHRDLRALSDELGAAKADVKYRKPRDLARAIAELVKNLRSQQAGSPGTPLSHSPGANA